MNRRNLVIISVVLIIGLMIVIRLFNKKQSPQQTVSEEVNNPASYNLQSAQDILAQAVKFQEEGKILEAKQKYQEIISNYPDYQNIEEVQKQKEDLNMKLIFSNIVTPSSVIHDVVTGDTLGKLAKQYGTTIDLIKISNNLKSNIIRIGQKLRIWTGVFSIFVDKSQNKLILKNVDEVIKVYSVSTGENNSTPIGEFTITTKLVDPVWFNKGIVVPPESPENVLGSRWLGFDIPGYGIHGTINPERIGQSVTAGCVRMRNKEVEEIYTLVPIGTKVTIVD